MKTVLGILIAVVMLGTMAVVIWVLKGAIITGVILLGIGEVIYYRTTGEHTDFYSHHTEKEEM